MISARPTLLFLAATVAMFAYPTGSANAVENGAMLQEALAAVRKAQAARVEMIARVTPAVVCVFDQTRDGGGAGVLIDEQGYGLTNFHVVMNMLESRRGYGGLADGKLYQLEVLGIDMTGDMAMFKLSGRDRFPHVPLGDSEALRLGQTVLAMGNPFALANDYTPTVTFGIVTGLHRYQYGKGDSLVYTDCIQTDASINPGNSGGPLFDAAGNVVGINGRASFEERGRVNVGLAYAISINQIKRFLPALRAGLAVEHGSLGATVRNTGNGIVEIDELLPGSPASRAGLKLGDRLLRFGGRTIRSANEFASVLGTYPANWPVLVETERDGKQRKTRVRLARRPLQHAFEVDKNINQRALLRALNKAQQAIAPSRPLQQPAIIEYRAKRVSDVENPAPDRIAVRSERGGELTVTLLDPGAQPVSVTATDGTESWKMQDDQMEDVIGVGAALLRAERALHWLFLFPDSATDRSEWRHVGGDELNGRLLEVIEAPINGEKMRAAFDADSFLPVRLVVLNDEGDLRAEILVNNYRQAGGFHLPHALEFRDQTRLRYRLHVEHYTISQP